MRTSAAMHVGFGMPFIGASCPAVTENMLQKGAPVVGPIASETYLSHT